MGEMKIATHSPNHYSFLFYTIVSIFLLLCYLTSVSFLSNRSFDRTDFGKFYNSSLLFYSGKNIYAGWVYTADTSKKLKDQHLVSEEKPTIRLTNLNTPVLALMMLPFGTISYSSSLWAWTLLSLFAGVASVLLVQRTYGNRQWSISILLLCGFFAYYPTFINITAGQVELITLFFLVLGWRLGRAKQDAYAGIVIGLAFSIKLFIGLFLVLFLLRRQWRVVGWILFTVFITALIATLFLGKPVYLQYLHVFQQVKWYSATWNASLYGFLMRLFGSPYEKNIPLFYYPSIVHFLYVFGVSLILLGMLWITRFFKAIDRRIVWEKQYDLTFSYTIVAMLLISPLAWNYYFPSLIIPIIFAILSAAPQSPSRASFMHLIIAIVLFLSGMPENSLKPHEITHYAIIAWSSCYFLSLVLLLLELIIISKSDFMIRGDANNTLNKFHLTQYFGWYVMALLPSIAGIGRMVIALSPQ